MLSVFFFFQAEDGIRDLTVTGVQTCALPISLSKSMALDMAKYKVTSNCISPFAWSRMIGTIPADTPEQDRKSTRLNSSHSQISYAVFCLKKKKKPNIRQSYNTKN